MKCFLCAPVCLPPGVQCPICRIESFCQFLATVLKSGCCYNVFDVQLQDLVPLRPLSEVEDALRRKVIVSERKEIGKI